jgi:hypothetical protein
MKAGVIAPMLTTSARRTFFMAGLLDIGHNDAISGFVP